MNAATKLAAYGAIVGILFAAAAALGVVVGPIDVGGSEHEAPATVHTEGH